MLDSAILVLILTACTTVIGFFAGRFFLKKDLKDAENEIAKLLLDKQ